MDKMSILKLILVTVPESVLNIYIAFLFTGDRLKLPFKCPKNELKKYIMKLVLAVALFSLAQLIGRAGIQSLYTYSIYNISISIVILRSIYGKFGNYDRDKKLSVNIKDILSVWKKPFYQVCIMTFVLMTIENLYIPLALDILKISSYTDAYRIPWVNLVIPQVDRFFQILIVSLLWDFSRVKNNVRNHNYNKFLFIIVFFYIILFEFSVSYLYLKYFNVYSLNIRYLLLVFLASMSIFNIYVYKTTLDIVDKTYLHIKKGEN